MKRIYKRSIAFNVLTGRYTVEYAARLVQVQPATVRRWLKQFGPEFLRLLCSA